MNRLLPAACALTLMLLTGPLAAQSAAPAPASPAAPAKPRAVKKPPTKVAAAKPSSRRSTAAATATAGAAAAAGASAVLDLPLTPGQLAAAERVHTGQADCEHRQSVQVERVAGQAGHFDVRFGNRSFRMVPEETTTGAVRLHDARAQVVWLQIPSKSMMLDQKAGQRLADLCLHAEQREGAATQVAATAPGEAASAPASGSLLEPAR